MEKIIKKILIYMSKEKKKEQLKSFLKINSKEKRKSNLNNRLFEVSEALKKPSSLKINLSHI